MGEIQTDQPSETDAPVGPEPQQGIAKPTNLKDRLLTLLHIRTPVSRDIKLKPVSVKLNREHIRANNPQEDASQA